MLGRRSFLAAACSGAAALILPGCALAPAGDPTIAPAPTPTPLAGQAGLTALRTVLERARRSAWPAPQAQVVAWALGVTADQLVTVSLPSPSPLAAPTASPSPGTTAEPDAVAALADAFTTAGDAFRTQALDADTARPHVWAAMAAWAAVVAGLWAAPAASLEPARAVLDPPPQSGSDALQGALDAAAEAAYGLQEVAGTVGLGAEEVAALQARIAAWHGLRDALLDAVGPTPTPEPSPGRPWYDLDRPGDPEAARTLAAKLEAATLPILGRSIAHGPAAIREVVVDALAAAAAQGPRWGGLVERWPGLPL